MNDWLSIDPAKGVAGIAFWTAADLKGSFVIKPRGNKGAFYCGAEICASRCEAWDRALTWATRSTVVIEDGAGGRANIVKAQGWMGGYICRACEIVGAVPKMLNVSEWRRVIKEDHGISWPQNRDRKKALAVQLVRDLYGLTVGDDEADAILIGRAALRTGIVDINARGDSLPPQEETHGQ